MIYYTTQTRLAISSKPLSSPVHPAPANRLDLVQHTIYRPLFVRTLPTVSVLLPFQAARSPTEFDHHLTLQELSNAIQCAFQDACEKTQQGYGMSVAPL